MANFNFEDLSLKDYKECWDYQETIHSEIVADKLVNKKSSEINRFLLVEHPHVYTLGKSGDEHNLLINADFLKKIDAVYYKIDRGGDITYHGPGQLVGYPILDLENLKIGVKEYIFRMEQAIIQTIAEFGLEGTLKDDATGVWLDAGIPAKSRKISAIGVRISRYVSMHGFALNVNTDMRYFNYINPCGFITYGVTSIKKELGRKIDMQEVKEIVKAKFNGIY
ncbi:MAG: lipoyl(octanoyl) transferase LipB [Bacteroidia bacterium]|jgi:lipoyl(octanoyl) transferase